MGQEKQQVFTIKKFHLISGYDQTQNILPIYETEISSNNLKEKKNIQPRVLKGLKRLTVPLL